MAPTVMVTTRKHVHSCQAIKLGIVLLSVVLLPLVVAFSSESGPTDPVKTRVNPEPVKSGNSQRTGISFYSAATGEVEKLYALVDEINARLAIKVVSIFVDQIKKKPTEKFAADLNNQYDEIAAAVRRIEKAESQYLLMKVFATPSALKMMQKDYNELKGKWDKLVKLFPEDVLERKFVIVREKTSNDEFDILRPFVVDILHLIEAFKANNQDQVKQSETIFQKLKSKVEELYNKYSSTGSAVSGTSGCCNASLPANECARRCVLYGGAVSVIALLSGGALWYSPDLRNWAKNLVGMGPSVPETTKMAPTTTTEPSSTDSASEASQLWIIVAVVALIAALAVAFYCFVVRKRTSSSQDTEGATASYGAPTGKTQQATGDKSTQAPVTATPSTGTSTTPSGNVKSKTGAQRSAKASPSTASSGAITSSKASAQEKPKSIRATSSKVPSGTPKA